MEASEPVWSARDQGIGCKENAFPLPVVVKLLQDPIPTLPRVQGWIQSMVLAVLCD